MSGAIDQDEKAIARRLRLRARPPSVMRVSRRALVACGSVLGLGLAAALGWSLIERGATAPAPVFAPAPPPPETVTDLPRDYAGRGAVPVLGPPLPGDLGRPILRAQAEAQGTVQAPPSPSPSLSPGPAEPLTVRARSAANGAVTGAARAPASAGGLFVAITAPPTSSGGAAAASSDHGPEADPRLVSVERLQAPASPYILQAGAIIPAALITGLRSDVPGVAIAQVTQNVFDSLDGRYLLIPQGARLIGEYDAQAAVGQGRLGVVWTRLTLPSGRSILLDKLPGADVQGMAGLRDGIDRHGREILAAAVLSTLLAIGAESGSGGESDLSRAVRRGASQGISDLGRQMVGRSLSRAPTLTIRPGAALRILLTRDLVLEPYQEGR